MDTVRQRLGFLALVDLSDTLRHRLVGQEHELLNELVGIFRALEVTTYGLSFLIDVEVEFLSIELHATVLEPLGPQFLSQAVKGDELVGIFTLIPLRTRRWCGLSGSVDDTVVLQKLLHLLIGIAAVRLYHRVDKAEGLDVGIVVEVEHGTVTRVSPHPGEGSIRSCRDVPGA